MLNLILRLQTFHTLLSSKVWHHLLTAELYRSNLPHDFIHYIADLIDPVSIFRFSLRITCISDPKREYKCLDNLVNF